MQSKISPLLRGFLRRKTGALRKKAPVFGSDCKDLLCASGDGFGGNRSGPFLAIGFLARLLTGLADIDSAFTRLTHG